MNDIFALADIALGFVLALAVAHEIASSMRRMVIRRAADRIAEAYSTEQALASASLFLREKLEFYRLERLRVGLGASRSTHAAATALVDEYRLFRLERGQAADYQQTSATGTRTPKRGILRSAPGSAAQHP